MSDGCEELVKLYRQFKTYYENNKHVLCEEELNESLNDMLLNVDTSTPHSSFMGSGISPVNYVFCGAESEFSFFHLINVMCFEKMLSFFSHL